LGVRLLNRTTRSVALTEAGAALLGALQPALGQIAEAVDAARSAQAAPSGPLRINAPEPAVEWVLAPMAAAFMAAYPDVRLEVTAEAALIDIVARGFDAGVRWGESLAQDMVAVSLGPPQRSVVVALRRSSRESARPPIPASCCSGPACASGMPAARSPPGNSRGTERR
jgi:DNA-binding transcriptional LysR family regulator